MPDQEPFDLDSITLDEMIEVELSAGRAFLPLVQSRTGLLTVVLFLRAYRQHANERGWSGQKEWSKIVSTHLSESYKLRSVSPQDSPAESLVATPLGS